MTDTGQRPKSESGVKALLDTIGREISRRRRRIVLALLPSVACMAVLIAIGAGAPGTRAFVSTLIRGALYVIVGLVAWSMRASGERVRATQQLAAWRDVNAVGDLVEASRFHDRATRRAAGTALKRVLPAMTEDGSRLLDTHQRRLLYRMLVANRDEALSLEVIKTLAKISDAGAMPTLREIAGAPASGRHAGLRDAAVSCLRYLEARVEEEHTRATLLRASEPGAEPAGLLLRAGGGGPQTTDDLLRTIEGPRAGREGESERVGGRARDAGVS